MKNATQYRDELSTAINELNAWRSKYEHLFHTIENDSNISIDSMTRTLKIKYVNKHHVKADGTPRSITEPHGKVDYYATYVDGKKRITAKTMNELYDKLHEYYSSIDISFKTMFFRALSQKNCSENTIFKYQKDYERFISEDFASKDITTMDIGYIKQYVTDFLKKEGNIKKKAFNSFKSVLSLAFGYADSKDICPNIILNKNKFNDSEFAKLLSYESKKAEDKAFSQEQIDTMRNEIQGRINKSWRENKCYTVGYMFLLSINTGMRAAELCALKWEDINYLEHSIHIHSQILRNQHTNTHVYVGYTKNEKGIPKGGRYFPLSDEICNLLLMLKMNQSMVGIKSEYVFANQDGSFILPNTCYEKFLLRLTNKFGYSCTNNHAIRMYFNSYVLIPASISLADRAKLLGHSPDVNLKNYTFERHDYCDYSRNKLNQLLLTTTDDQSQHVSITKNIHESQQNQAFMDAIK